MYDFLDKIGLKAVLEAIKGKIPTSLPANGGNADTLGNKHASDFANSYNDDLMKFLNGQSGDIRTLVQQLPLGGYIFNTTTSELSGITFPIYGNGIMSWVACKYSANDLRYGILIIRPMTSVGAMYICSVYNTYSYTDWEQISTTPIKSITFSGTTNADGVCQLGMAIDKYQVLAIVGNTVDEHDLVFTPWIWGLPDPTPSMWGFSVTEFGAPLTRKINIPFSITVYYVEL